MQESQGSTARAMGLGVVYVASHHHKMIEECVTFDP
jgi:hypothetical protein